MVDGFEQGMKKDSEDNVCPFMYELLSSESDYFSMCHITQKAWKNPLFLFYH